MKIKPRVTVVIITLVFLLISTIGSAQQLTLTPSNYNGYNISCFGMQNGSINLTVTGGTPPYTYLWSNQETNEDISNLASGYYRVTVDDADPLTQPVDAEITLTEPIEISLTLEPFKYPNGHNISLFGACNGAITVNISDGVPPYAFDWSDGGTQQNRTSVCSGVYGLKVIDQNGCASRPVEIYLTEPDRTDWKISGNEQLDPNTMFMGSSDLSDVIFKTNGQERLRIHSGGSLQLTNLQSSSNHTGLSLLYVDDQGILQKYLAPCPSSGFSWLTGGNTLVGTNSFLGSCDVEPLVFKTSNTERARIASSGEFQINDGVIPSFPIEPKLLVVGATINPDPIEVRFMNNALLPEACNLWIQNTGIALGVGVESTNESFIALESGGAINKFLRFNQAGEIGIQTAPQAGYDLVIDGKVGVREMYVKLNGAWPDYVFGSDYNLLSLADLKTYIEVNNRLPGMPSSVEVANEGQNISEIQRLQQEKIEELILYIIQLNYRLEELENENKNKK